jgi:PAS domain S-box-containing protein
VQSQFETFLETVPDAMVVVDRNGRIVMLNRNTERLFGYRRDQLLGLPVEVLVPERYRRSHSEHRAGYSAAPIVRPMGAAQELYGRRKDGSEFPVEISLSPVETEQGVLVASAIRDITDRKRAEAQRASLIREHAARAEAEAANRAKDEFLAMLSHELRNPLGAVVSAVAVLDKIGAPDEPALRARAIIRRQAERLSRMLDDLLDIARLQTGKIVLTTQHLDLADLVRRSLATLRDSGSLDHHDITVDCEQVWVETDPARVEQVFDNLMLNALKFTPKNGSVRVRVHADGSDAVLKVTDSGVGMALARPLGRSSLGAAPAWALDRGPDRRHVRPSPARAPRVCGCGSGSVCSVRPRMPQYAPSRSDPHGNQLIWNGVECTAMVPSPWEGDALWRQSKAKA